MTPKQLIEFRLGRELTQTGLGKLFGRGLRTVQRWESGASPIPVAVAKLVTLLKKSEAGYAKRG